MQSIESTEDVENFMLKHGENVVDTLGAEVDRIEKLLKVCNVIMWCLQCGFSNVLCG